MRLANNDLKTSAVASASVSAHSAPMSDIVATSPLGGDSRVA
jgi:hypothetical protein